MKFLNLACGATRPQSTEWVNMDRLWNTLPLGTPERTQLDSESNYIESDLDEDLPFRDGEFSGILASHCIEHFDCMEAVKIMKECHRVLEPGGVLMVSVPDATYFRDVNYKDTKENAVELFGEPIYEPDGEETFTGYALWNKFHKAIISEDSLWHYFKRAGFEKPKSLLLIEKTPTVREMMKLLNRMKFSLIMTGIR